MEDGTQSLLSFYLCGQKVRIFGNVSGSNLAKVNIWINCYLEMRLRLRVVGVFVAICA
jgi:hypothetical protein